MPYEQPAEPLHIDRSAPAPLADDELRAWASGQRGFISSVMAGMGDERAAALSALEELGVEPVLFERLGGRDDDAQSAYLDGVRSSDLYIGILGARYGLPAPGGYSATEAEYREAIRSGLRVGVWATSEPMDGRQQDFLGALRVFHTTATYADPGDLRRQISARLRALAAEACSPWCKLGHAVFRARRLSDEGPRASVVAIIRDDDVIAALEALRPSAWSGAANTRLTCAGRSHAVRVDEVVVETTAGRSRTVRVEMTKIEDRASSMDVGVGDLTPDDLTELAMRVTLLDEPNPLGPLSSFAEMADPFALLADAGLSEEMFPGVAEVLLTEELVGSRRAERLTSVRIGPKRSGSRRVAIEWLPRRRYSNVIPERRRIEGEVRG